ncbi:hypothetical protein COO60DRAFT_1210886 [Scenedesmus sp. NREL 46B-D3]|nr:hypothetical protein COO60DRAFT_1210886 [Scenedesmus sp. NREL 46B-D3]
MLCLRRLVAPVLLVLLCAGSGLASQGAFSTDSYAEAVDVGATNLTASSVGQQLEDAQNGLQNATAELSGKQAAYDAANQTLQQAQQAADAAKGAVDNAAAAIKVKQATYDQAVVAKAAAKAAYELAQKELQNVQQAVSNASTNLLNVSKLALSAGQKMDRAQLAAAEAAQKAIEAERDLRLLKSQLLLAMAKQQSLKLQIMYAQMNVSALEGELSRAMAQKAQTSGALSEAVAVKVAAEQRLNSILAAKPVAAKLYAGATNASYQANATRSAAQQALLKAQANLVELKQALEAAQGKKQAALGKLAKAPAQFGAAQFRVASSTGKAVAAEAAWAAANLQMAFVTKALERANATLMAALDGPGSAGARASFLAAQKQLEEAKGVLKQTRMTKESAQTTLAAAKQSVKKAESTVLSAPLLLLELDSQIADLTNSAIPQLQQSLVGLKRSASATELTAKLAMAGVHAAERMVVLADEKAAQAEKAWQAAEDKVDELLDQHNNLLTRYQLWLIISGVMPSSAQFRLQIQPRRLQMRQHGLTAAWKPSERPWWRQMPRCSTSRGRNRMWQQYWQSRRCLQLKKLLRQQQQSHSSILKLQTLLPQRPVSRVCRSSCRRPMQATQTHLPPLQSSRELWKQQLLSSKESRQHCVRQRQQ